MPRTSHGLHMIGNGLKIVCVHYDLGLAVLQRCFCFLYTLSLIGSFGGVIGAKESEERRNLSAGAQNDVYQLCHLRTLLYQTEAESRPREGSVTSA